MTGAIDKELFTYIEKLNGAQKKSLLGFIKSILPAKEEEYRATIEEYNRDLEEAEAEIERGECYTHEEATDFFKKILSGR